MLSSNLLLTSIFISLVSSAMVPIVVINPVPVVVVPVVLPVCVLGLSCSNSYSGVCNYFDGQNCQTCSVQPFQKCNVVTMGCVPQSIIGTGVTKACIGCSAASYSTLGGHQKSLCNAAGYSGK